MLSRRLLPCPALLRPLFDALALAALGLAASCGGGGPPDQTPALREEMVGTATGGETTGPQEAAGEFAAKGAAGVLRTASVQGASLEYRVNLTQLTPPYALRAVLGDNHAQAMTYTVATTQGTANITPLTSLLVAQLYGQDPAAIYNAFGASVDTSRITDADLAQAQSALVAYLQESLGFAVPATLGSFVTTPFKAVPGDTMYDTVVQLAAALRARDMSFQSLSDAVALAARLCLTEKMVVTTGGVATDFCPRAKAATPRVGDPGLIDHVFTDRRDATLSLQVRGDTVLGVRYETAAGTSYTCSGSGCSGVTAGAAAADLTRPFVFAPLSLQGSGGSAVLEGRLTSAIPGVMLPVLPCETNRFIVVFSDRSVTGQCADPDPYGFGVGGVPGGLIGVDASRGTYDFSAPFGNDVNQAKVSVITDAYDAVLAVQFTDNEPDTYVPRRRFVCVLAACQGITLGPLTINTDFGGPDFPFYVRTLNFADTLLTGVDDAGAPTGETATMKASLSAAYLLPIPPVRYPPLAACADGLSALPVTAEGAADGTAFNACVPPGTTFVDPDTGDIQLQASSVFESDDKLSIVLRDGAVASVTLHLSVVPGDFVCSGGCAGVEVSAPDAGGGRTVIFDAAALHEQFFGFDGPRAVHLGGSLGFAPPAP